MHIAARAFEAHWGLTPMSPLDRTGKESSGAATAGVDVARSLTDAPQDGAGVEPTVAVVTAAAAAAPAALLVHDPYAGAVDDAVGQRLHHAPARHPAFASTHWARARRPVWNASATPGAHQASPVHTELREGGELVGGEFVAPGLGVGYPSAALRRVVDDLADGSHAIGELMLEAALAAS
ncbi:hypothetical protein [Streptomyces sp. NRRL S-241]|uniref:hypothetical protein n=1 Tax=Streptomyces sp. NRRL S-241 TaxID=1463896 RepID=UPI0004C02B71